MPILKGDRVVLRMITRRLFISIFLVLLLSKQLAAGERDANIVALNLDPARTTIRWTLKDVIHTVHGTFKLKRGFVRFDMNTGKAEGLMEVDARSGDSGNSSRDAHMHNLILESSKYPVIRFRPERVYGKPNARSAQDITVDGTFELHGSAHPLQLHMNVRPEGNGYSATTHFAVPHVAWGLKDPSTFLIHVSNEVEIDVETAATPAQL
jgi:polyisoprenoid-binding protein YceI